MQTTLISRLGPDDAGEIADVLCEAFRDYPVMRFVLGPGGRHDERLRQLIGLFVATRTLRNDPVFGIHDGARLVAVMTTSNPADPQAAEFPALRDTVWQRLGADARQRYDMCVRTWTALELHVPQLHVNMIGVRDTHRGAGLARALLTEVQRLCEASDFAEGISLTTEVPRNVELYQHLGYDIIGEARIADALRTWSLFRKRGR